MSEWQDIKTAPKDGTHILVYQPLDWPAVAYWYTEGEEWAGWLYADELLSDIKPEGPSPTHWVPLPPEPST